MEGPTGYQFVGRTCQMWNSFHETPEFTPGHPWLLRFFDQIRFHPVSEKGLLDFRAAFPRGPGPAEDRADDVPVVVLRA
jgi:urea carboxylase